VASSWNGLGSACKKMPKAILERFNKEINNALYDPQTEKIFQELHIDPKVSTPA
jgi:tripartite-type tricarboxylate transporter receptor subunit TctC